MLAVLAKCALVLHCRSWTLKQLLHSVDQAPSLERDQYQHYISGCRSSKVLQTCCSAGALPHISATITFNHSIPVSNPQCLLVCIIPSGRSFRHVPQSILVWLLQVQCAKSGEACQSAAARQRSPA